MIKNLIKSFLIKKRDETKKSISSSKDFYLYAGFILAIALISSLWSGISLYKSQKIALQNQLTNESQLIDTRLNNYLNNISHIAEDKGHKISLKDAELQYIAHLFKRNFFFPVTKSGLKKKAFTWPHFSWIDKKGNILVKSEIGVLSKAKKAKNSKHLYQSSTNPWQLNLSDPYFDSFANKTFIDASIGISDLDSEKHIGTISTKINIGKLIKSIKEDLQEDTKFIILNEELKIIIGSDENLQDVKFFAKNMAEVDSNIDFFIIKNQLKYNNNTYVIYKKSYEYPFIILTGYDSSSFQKEFITNYVERFLSLFGAAIFIGIILFFQRQKIIKSEKKTNEKLIELNSKLEYQNEAAKKSKQSRDKFLSQSRQSIIEDTIIKITQDVNKILDCENKDILVTKKTIHDTHKKILTSCAKILSYICENFNFTNVSTKKIIEESIEMAHHDADINNVKLHFEAPLKISDIYADERSMKHVIISLINYAMDDRKRGKEVSFVKITAKNKKQKDQKFLQIVFQDNGHGISEEMRMNFEQASQKENTNSNNTSLSLYAIRSILSSHNATLQIDNISGKGSIITIQIAQKSPTKKIKEDPQGNDTPSGDSSESSNVINLFP